MSMDSVAPRMVIQCLSNFITYPCSFHLSILPSSLLWLCPWPEACMVTFSGKIRTIYSYSLCLNYGTFMEDPPENLYSIIHWLKLDHRPPSNQSLFMGKYCCVWVKINQDLALSHIGTGWNKIRYSCWVGNQQCLTHCSTYIKLNWDGVENSRQEVQH